jgi:hypothetical protein
MKGTLTRLGAVAALALTVTWVVAAAQWNEQYWRRYNKKQVEQIIDNVENSTDSFRKDFDRWLDHSRYDGREKEDKFNSKVKKFEDATDRLRNRFDREDSWWETRNEVEKMLAEARTVAQMMRNREFGRDVENQWRRLRIDINKLASTYRLPLVGDRELILR